MHNNPTPTCSLDDWTEYRPHLQTLANDIGGYNINKICLDQTPDPSLDQEYNGIENKYDQYFEPTKQDLAKAAINAEIEEAKSEAQNERNQRTQIIEMNSNYIREKIYGNGDLMITHKLPSDTISLKAIDTNNGLITHRVVRGIRIQRQWGKDHNQHMEQLKKDGELY